MTPSSLRPLRVLQQIRASRPALPQLRRSLATAKTTSTSPHALTRPAHGTLLPASATTTRAWNATNADPKQRVAALHTSAPRFIRRRRVGHNGEEVPDVRPPTDFSRLDMLGSAPVPSTSVDICSTDGFKLDSGVSVYHGRGVLLVGGEAFEWQPWGPDMRLLNERGQWEVHVEAFGLLDLLWPRPDLLVLGLGPHMQPLSPTVRRYLSGLGLRVEVLDTRNAASQFNMLATERGVEDVAAALIPIGWKEGIGADWA